MTRPRDLTRSHQHHVLNRGVDGQDIFGVHDDREFFEAMISEHAGPHAVDIEAYAWMSNHFHLLVDTSRTEPSALSNFMHRVQGASATMFNERTSRRGPLFQSRFVAVAIESETQYLRVARYIHRNPIDITGSAALAAYSHSSLGAYLGRWPAPGWLSTGRLMSLIDPVRYLDVVRGADPDDCFPHAFCPAQHRVDLDLLERSVASIGSVAPHLSPVLSDLTSELAICMRLDDVVALAAHFGVSPRALRQRADRTRRRILEDPTVDRLRTRILHEVRGAAPDRADTGFRSGPG